MKMKIKIFNIIGEIYIYFLILVTIYILYKYAFPTEGIIYTDIIVQDNKITSTKIPNLPNANLTYNEILDKESNFSERSYSSQGLRMLGAIAVIITVIYKFYSTF